MENSELHSIYYSNDKNCSLLYLLKCFRALITLYKPKKQKYNECGLQNVCPSKNVVIFCRTKMAFVSIVWCPFFNEQRLKCWYLVRVIVRIYWMQLLLNIIIEQRNTFLISYFAHYFSMRNVHRKLVLLLASTVDSKHIPTVGFFSM